MESQPSSHIHTVLVVEDQAFMVDFYRRALATEPLHLIYIATGRESIEYLQEYSPAAVLLDLGLPDIDGMEVLAYVKQQQLSCAVIIVTCENEVAIVVKAMRMGAFDYLEKPIRIERLQWTLRNALHQYELQSYIDSHQYAPIREHYHNLIGSSRPMQLLYQMLDNIAPGQVDILITGETGTGKEVCAEAIHQSSHRADKPLVTVDCAAIPENLLESHIFGHIRGAFTGATYQREGAAIQAQGGTLFLDEIGELDWSSQASLLRFVQTKTLQRVGSDREENVDVRIICATNRDLLAEVKAGHFREDLFYRLDVVRITLPPLRSRGKDILRLARLFLSRLTEKECKAFKEFTPEAEELLLQYSWPGNVRQLQNLVYNIVILNHGTLITDVMVKKRLNECNQLALADTDVTGSDAKPSVILVANNTLRSFEDIRKDVILTAIRYCEGRVPEAAKLLGIGKSTIYRELQNWENGDLLL